MTKIEREVVIQASAEAVADYSQDGERTPEWYAGVTESYPSETWPQPGASLRQVYTAAGISFEMTLQVTDFEYARKFYLDMDGMITGSMHWTLTPKGDAETHVHVAVDYDMPGGGLGKIADKLFVERMNSQNLEESLNNLRLHFET